MTPCDIRAWAEHVEQQRETGSQIDAGERSQIAAEALRLYANAREVRTDERAAPKFVRGQARLRAWREFRGLSVAELARKVGISEAYVWQLEASQRVGTLKTLQRIAAVLSISVSDMIDPATWF